MKSTDIRQLAKYTDCRLFGRIGSPVANVKIDSREAKEGDLFVCIVGENNDGHKYAENAYSQGCRYYLMSDVQAASQLLQNHEDACVVLARDTTLAIRDMAAGYLSQFRLKKIAVTGSVGKTSTKSFTAQVMSAAYNTVCTQKNLNTHLGLCLTCFLADDSTQAVVFEMGMDRSHEIEEYCEWVKPETCLITNIGVTHMEKLGSREAIADAKLEITKHLTMLNPLIYNADSDFLDDYSLAERTKLNFYKFPVGENLKARLRVDKIEDLGLQGIKFKIIYEGKATEIHLPLPGTHNAINAALACACGISYGITPQECALALSKASGTDRRMAVEKLEDMMLIDDSYNASPVSMAAALQVLGKVPCARRIAVLADMYELGDAERDGHLLTGQRAAENKIDLLFAIGKNADLYEKGALDHSGNIEVRKYPDVGAAENAVLQALRPGDAVLVKGSNSTMVSKIASSIKAIYGGKI